MANMYPRLYFFVTKTQSTPFQLLNESTIIKADYEKYMYVGTLVLV